MNIELKYLNYLFNEFGIEDDQIENYKYDSGTEKNGKGDDHGVDYAILKIGEETIPNINYLLKNGLNTEDESNIVSENYLIF